MHHNTCNGFTLLEMAIVLVIIGLVVGGILTGREMIEASYIRGTVSQVQKYRSAVNAFQEKYNCLPGDCSNPSDFGFFSAGMTGFYGLGDGNGLIQSVGYSEVPDGPRLIGEALVFWRHLSDAGLIDWNCGAGLVSGGKVPSDQTAAQAYLWFPAAKLGTGNYFVVYSQNGAEFLPANGFLR